jgi:hypothetical protein
MATHIPKQALSLLANTAVLASKHGLKQGMAKAAVKANPALLVLEAAVSVAGAVNSYLVLKEARVHRDGLSELLPHEEKKLEAERELLAKNIELAKRDIAQKEKVQERLGNLVLACSSVYRTVWNELHAIRSSDLPDIEDFDAQLIELENVWSELKHALYNYNEAAG